MSRLTFFLLNDIFFPYYDRRRGAARCLQSERYCLVARGWSRWSGPWRWRTPANRRSRPRPRPFAAPTASCDARHGTVPFELFRGQRLVLSGHLNSVATDMMLDSGAGMTV